MFINYKYQGTRRRIVKCRNEDSDFLFSNKCAIPSQDNIKLPEQNSLHLFPKR